MARCVRRAYARAYEDNSYDKQSTHFLTHLLNRHVLWLARRLTGLGLGNYSHVIKCAAFFTRYSRAGTA